MKILAIVDKFKNTLTSKQIGKICKKIFEKKGFNVDYIPISDGGDGFLDCINYKNNLQKIYCYAHSANGKRIKTYYYQLNDDIYIETAKIIGYRKDSTFDIKNASSYGLGEVIKKAIKNHGKNIYIGLGGTLTNDAGIGMFEALGFVFEKDKIIWPKLLLENNVSFHIISDVTNPLIGPNGATYMFAKQKGATKNDLPILENKIKNFSLYINKILNNCYNNLPAAGAAGGLGFAFLSVLKAQYHHGINFMLDYLNIKNILPSYDIVITGEGQIDTQSLYGKTVFEILNYCQKKTIIICAINKIKTKIYNNNIIGLYSIVPSNATKEQSLKNPKFYLEKLLKNIKI